MHAHFSTKEDRNSRKDKESSRGKFVSQPVVTRSTYKLRPITGSALSSENKNPRSRVINGANFFFFEIGRIESISLWALSIRKREESRGYYWRWKSIGEVSRLILRMIGSQYLPGTIPFLHAIVPFHQSFTNGRGEVVSILIIELSPIVVERPIASAGMIAATNL